MKKTIMALALGAASCGVANAQTSVVLYGIGDGDVRIDHTAIGTLKSVGSGGESGTRWGIRGTEDLGNGLKALFTFEQGFDISDNSSPQGNIGPVTNGPQTSTGTRLFSRTAQVGLSWDKGGDLLLGRAYTPFYVAWTAIDPMAGGFAGGAQNFATGNLTRYDNGIYYNSPKLYGFQFQGAYRLGESATNSRAAGATEYGGYSGNAAVSYAAGPLLVEASFLSIRNALNTNTQRVYFGGIAYDFKFIKLDAMYFHNHSPSTTTSSIRSYSAGVTVPIQAFNIFAQVARIDNRSNGNDSLGALQKFDDANFIGVGANYNLSKRTDIYLSYAKQNNNGNALNVVTDASNAGLFTTTGTLANVTPGFNPWSAQLGIRHKF